jgi:hypothetical protein
VSVASANENPRNSQVVLSIFLVVALGAATIAQGQQRSTNDGPENEQDRDKYEIGLWGDLPYSDMQALTGIPNLIADVNQQELAFTVHDGDLKAGNGTPGSVTPTTCVDALYTLALGFFNSLKAHRSIRNTGQSSPHCLKECEWKVNVSCTYFSLPRLLLGRNCYRTNKHRMRTASFSSSFAANFLMNA